MATTLAALLLLPAPPRWLLALAACAAAAVWVGLAIVLVEEVLRK